MSINLGDTWYPHHPDYGPLGDICKNTRYTTGGNIWYQVVDDFDKDTSWDILNEWVQTTAWDILNDFDNNTAWDIINDFLQAVSWDVLNTFVQSTSFDIINTFDRDTSWDVINEWIEQTAWDILNDFIQNTSWHIFPASIPYIAQFLINRIRSNFGMELLTSTFEVSPVGTNFTISRVIEDNVSLKPIDIDTSFIIVPVVYTFTLTDSITSNFKITRVLNNTRTPYGE